MKKICKMLAHRLAVVLGVLTLLIVVAAPAGAQFNASLQGTITDATGGVIPGAHVKLLNNGTQATQEATANDQGFYRFNQLPAGMYTLTVDATGFATSSVTDVQVVADLAQTKDVTLQAGNIQTTTTVTASAVPTLQTADASVSGTITSQAIETLPTFGRDPYELVRTMPGIDGTGARSGNGQAATLGNTTGPGGSSVSIFQTENQLQVSSSGQRVEQNVFLLDGVSVNSLGWGGAAVVTPNSESVQDITVITSDYLAEDGRGSGAHIKITSKSGTDQFHGSALFLYQDPNLNAFNKWGGPDNAPPVRVQNAFRQYAGSVGGPIKKDKLFFFASYEGLRNKSISYGQEWVITPQTLKLIAAQNNTMGKIFSSVNNMPRIVAVLGGPSTTCAAVFGSTASTLCRDVPGGLDVGSPGPGVAGTPYYPIPALGPTPAKNLPLAIGGGFDGVPDLEFVQYYLPSTQKGNQINGRIDYNLTSNDLIFASGYFTHLNSVSADAASAGAPDTDVTFKPVNTAITAGYIKTINASTINELRANFTRFFDNGVSDNPNINWGIPYIKMESYPFGAIYVAGAPQSPDTPSVLAQNTYEVRDTLIKVWGNHTVRFGGNYRKEQDNNNLFGSVRPIYSFSGLWNLANAAPIFEGISANVNTGGPGNAARYYRDSDDALFVQDDWHASPSLTLNLGLRWEYFAPVTEKQGNLANVFLYATGPAALANSAVRHVGQLWNDNWKDFMPKIGFAFAPLAAHERFVVRGGFGISYNRQNINIYANGAEDIPNNFNFNLCCGTAPKPFSFSTPFAGGNIQFYTGSNNSPNSYPANSRLAVGVNPITGTPNAMGAGTPPAVEVYGAWPNTPDAYTYLYSFETQTQVAKDIAFILGYQGAVSHHLIRLVNQNFLYSNAAGTVASPFFAAYIPTPDVNASYNAMYARMSKTFSMGFSVDATYTWSHSIDMLSAEGPGAVTNQTDPVHAQTDEYGASDYDSRHRFVASGLWTVPIFPHDKGFLHSVFGGWQLGAIVTAYSGFPWTPVTGSQSSVAAVPGAATIAPTRPVQYFNNANPNTNSNTCFQNGCEFGGTNQTVPIVGTNYFNISHPGPPGIGRNSFRGPGFFSTDATLSKRFALPFINEAAGIEVRGMAFNVFNQLNLIPFPFGDNDTKVENPNFGRPTGALAGRSIELQARFTF
ncbi:MAG: TonB-dependent receptor [Acidobacteriaceae bacterium]|nr:TonB-dependent receptor [Acidobacteriaceae bacterium]MBV9781014.1 TonB-dependent receptor [Acidobacteriaceae bacterium]